MYSKLLVVCNLLQLRIELLSSLFCDDNTHTNSSSGPQKSRFPEFSTSKSSSGLLANFRRRNRHPRRLLYFPSRRQDAQDCHTFLLGNKTLRGACRSKRFALAGGTSPGWPTLDGPLWLAVCERRID
ncbi:unnamed protein product [Sphagnum troendelagicum]